MSDVTYLEALRTDLLRVAERETILRAAPGLAGPSRARMTDVGRPRRAAMPGGRIELRRPGRRVVVLAAAAFIALAGVVGYLVTRDGAPFSPRSQLGAPAPSPRDAGSGGAVALPSGAPAGPTFGSIHGGFTLGAAARQVSGADAGAADVGAAPTRPMPADGELIVKTAELAVEVPRGRFGQAFDRATAIAGPLGGFVSESSSAGRDTHSGTLTIRVPSTAFDRALAALRGLGRVVSQSIAGQDVTTEYVDLSARLRTWESQETALLRLMAKATSVEDTLRVQAQLQKVQLTIEQLKGQIRVLNDRTSKATLTVTINEPAAKTPPKVSNEVQNPSVGTALRRSIAGVLSVVVAIVVGIGYLAPVALLALLTWFVVRRTRRRRYAAA